MKEKNHHLYILVAASSVGKSDLMRKMEAEMLWKLIPKYSTRDVRINAKEKDDVVKIDTVQIAELGTAEAAEVRLNRINRIKELCGDNKGVVYFKNNNIYGITIESIKREIKENDLAVIISDFHVIKKLKKLLPDIVRVMYIASTIDERELLKRYKSREQVIFNKSSIESQNVIPNIKKMSEILSSAARLGYLEKIEEIMPLLNEQWNGILPYFDTIKTRAFNIRMLYNHYIDNIELIDHSILNFYDLEYMYTQARNIIKNPKEYTKLPSPPIFMVCAAPSSGKATLMEIVGDLGEVNQNIRITTKYAKRAKRITDKRDGMQAIGHDGEFTDYISDPSDIWQWEFHKNDQSKGTQYAVDHKEIKENLKDGIAQIFISNMGQINQAIKYYPDNIVVLYLHATHETETKKHVEAKCREDMIKKIVNEADQQEIFYEKAEKYLERENQYRRLLSEEIDKKLNEIQLVHEDFIENNHRIDHVLLNTGTTEDLIGQMINLINFYSNI